MKRNGDWLLALAMFLFFVGLGAFWFWLMDGGPTNQERIDRCLAQNGQVLLDHRDRYDGCKIGHLP